MANRLFYFPTQASEAGIAPAFYDEVPECFVADAIKAGGRDMTMNRDAWASYEAQMNDVHECYL